MNTIQPTEKQIKTDGRFKKGSKPWNKGKTLSVDMKKKLSNSHKGKHMGETSHQWKGDRVGYTALHDWVRSRLGTPSKCEDCGSEDKNLYEWANISKQYKRDLKDWRRLCKKCHTRFDGSTAKAIEATIARHAKRTLQTPEEKKEWQKRYRKNNKEYFKEYSKQYFIKSYLK